MVFSNFNRPLISTRGWLLILPDKFPRTSSVFARILRGDQNGPSPAILWFLKPHNPHEHSRNFPISLLPLNPYLLIPNENSYSYLYSIWVIKLLEFFLTLPAKLGDEERNGKAKILYMETSKCPSNIVTTRCFFLTIRIAWPTSAQGKLYHLDFRKIKC